MILAVPNFESFDGNVSYLDRQLLDESGRLKLLPASVYLAIDPLYLRAWCALNAYYTLPTVELVAWLAERIKGKRALEIGAGNGSLGRFLGIPMTDSYQQVDDSFTTAYFRANGLKPTKPAPDVEKEDGENAVRRRKPQVVIAAYVTEKWNDKKGQGNYLGVRYPYVIDRCETFILIGNLKTHGDNRAKRLPHEEHFFPWIITRAQYPSLNRILVWHNPIRL